MTRLNFSFTPKVQLSADGTPTRTVTGIAVPLNAFAQSNGEFYTFERDSIAFTYEDAPLLLNHNPDLCLGRYVSSQWTDDGFEVTFMVSATRLGDDALILAKDGALKFSIGVTPSPDGTEYVDGQYHVKTGAVADEVSLTPLPAFAQGTGELAVQMSRMINKEPIVADTTVAPQASVDDIKAAFSASLKETFPEGPVTLPQTSLKMSKEPLYSGRYRTKHDFMKDAWAGYHEGDAGAKERVDEFVKATFAVTQANVAATTPARYRGDLLIKPYINRHPLLGVIPQGPLTTEDLSGFVVPRITEASSLVAPHVEGVEPTAAVFTAAGSTYTPTAVSGKVDVTRELKDKAGPVVFSIIWDLMVQASADAREAKLVALFEALSATGAIALGTATGAELIDAIDDALLDLTQAERFLVLAAETDLFKAVAGARDEAGRKYYPVLGPQNAEGQRTAFRTLDMGPVQVVQVPSATRSYLIDPSCVGQWSTTPERLDFEYLVNRVSMGFWQYSTEAIINAAGVKVVTYGA